MIRSSCLFAILAMILLGSGCSLGGVHVKVSSDGSGEYQLMHMQFGENSQSDRSEIKGTEPLNAFDMSFQVKRYQFDHLSKVSQGKLSFNYVDQGKTVLIDVTVPVDPEAEWIQSMELSRKRFKNMKKKLKKQIEQKAGKQAKTKMARGFMNKFNEKIPVSITVQAPGEVLDIEVLKPEENAPDWTKMGGATKTGGPFSGSGMGGGSDSDQENEDHKASISIPVDEIFHSQIDLYKVRITADKGEIQNETVQNEGQKDKGDYHTKTFKTRPSQDDQEDDENEHEEEKEGDSESSY